MRKVKSDALWNQLTEAQRETLDRWLFDENLSYKEALPRAQNELGFKGQMSSLKRYYQWRSQEREVEGLANLSEEASEINGTAGELNGLRTATMKMVVARAFRAVRERADDVEKWGRLIDMMLRNDRNESRRELRRGDQEIKREAQRIRQELRTEDQKIKREALAFAKEKHQCDVIKKAVKMLPELRELEEARKDPDLMDYEENAVMNKLRRTAFGVVWEGLPESAKEEEEMLAALRERRERRQREEEARKNKEKITEPQPLTPSSPGYKEYLKWKEKEET